MRWFFESFSKNFTTIYQKNFCRLFMIIFRLMEFWKFWKTVVVSFFYINLSNSTQILNICYRCCRLFVIEIVELLFVMYGTTYEWKYWIIFLSIFRRFGLVLHGSLEELYFFWKSHLNFKTSDEHLGVYVNVKALILLRETVKKYFKVILNGSESRKIFIMEMLR